jgi:pimeloyl-ACP methyl ester carboxylesterase
MLLHSINAAPSAYEVKPLFEQMRHTHRVFAPDLPGYGFSDPSPASTAYR